MSKIEITSETKLTDIEQHFRVSAGPGAGKTHWLCEHIKNVLHRSVRLEKTRKIACITYTNTAVETILSRIGTSAERAEISTIHSFLYQHIIKPYAPFIAAEYGLNISEIDGHDDTILSNFGFINDWKTRTAQQRIREDNLIAKAFHAIKWKFDSSGALVAGTDYPHKVGSYSIKKSSYLEYKKMAWEKGVLHHDDVLFFSFQIIKKFPFVLEVLRSKFPYIFIDEFQDSSPIQVEIFRNIGLKESKIGIIGDQAQSIYKFQGADPTQFMLFSLPGIIDYVMKENRRSTNEIIEVLNIVRKDITQEKYRNESDSKPLIIIGDFANASQKIKHAYADEPLYSLSRDNITANLMKKQISGFNDSKLFEELNDNDKPGSGNKYRSAIVAICIKAIEYAREGKFKDAIKEMQKEFKTKTDPMIGKRKSLDIIVLLLSNYDTYKDGSLYDFFTFVKQNIKPEISDLRKGSAKSFYDNHTYQQMTLCVKIPEDLSRDKTIHKAKGDEFDNVLLILPEEKDLSFLLTPDTQNNEEHRVNYVAVSRAKNKLFISVPTLSATNMATLKSHFEIKTLLESI
ncbi:UvrD-helicase domain-containing protein [Flavobacterium sp. N2038]|uniref:UvrD-helicase domain-containing protein n=1 Tax=Flavobacterium sp. N2038 TaxID=2986829 RepID=UPI002224513E|nr:ATP-dependent helicase [Flavobacterium sp. N2038]